MPTPLGHALGGVSAGCLVVAASVLAPGPRRWRHEFERFLARIGPRRGLAGFACLAIFPDVDLLLGIHSGATHSVGATVIAAVVAGAWTRSARPYVVAAVAAAYGSHILLDWLGADPSAPRGVMALWPLTREFHLSDAHLFLRVCREYWLADCWWNNLRAVARELVILGPITAAAMLAARRAGAAQPACYGREGRSGPPKREHGPGHAVHESWSRLRRPAVACGRSDGAARAADRVGGPRPAGHLDQRHRDAAGAAAGPRRPVGADRG